MSSEFSTLALNEPANHILMITLDRVEASNAFNTLMGRELMTLFEELAMEPAKYRAIVVTGQGDKAFCAGGDLKERKGMSDEQWQAQHLVFERMIRAVIDCPIPVIGAINGAAYGGGCELVAALDFAYAVEHARFAQTETRIGIIPGIGGTQNLARAIGERRANEFIFTGKAFSAAQAQSWGLINEVLPTNAALTEAVLEIANEVAASAPLAVRQAKQAIHKGMQMSLSEGMAFEIEAYNRLVSTNDRLEGVLAFNEKRKAVFTGT